MFGSSPDIAGGVVPGTLATNDVSQTTFGCKATRIAAGQTRIDLGQSIPATKRRIWFANLSSSPLNCLFAVNPISDSAFTILTYTLGVGAGPALTETPANFAFSFGVSAVPE